MMPKHHKKPFFTNRFFHIITIIAIGVILISQVISLYTNYDFLSDILSKTMDEYYTVAVKSYRTLKMKNLNSSYSVDFNPTIEKTDSANQYIDYRKNNISFDDLMYKINSNALVSAKLDIEMLDSIYASILNSNDLFTDYELIVYKSGTDTIIARTNRISDISQMHVSQLKELDSIKDSQAFFINPARLYFKKMSGYVVLSGIMITIVILSLIYQLNIIRKQKKAEKVKKDFVDSMSHELRQPLQGALSLAEILANKSFSGNETLRNNAVNRIKQNLHNLNNLLDLIVEKTYSEELQQTAEWKIGCLKESIEEIVTSYTISSETKISFTTNFNNAKKYYWYDNTHLPNAIKNLVDNAVKYSKSDIEPRIDITLSEIKSNLYIIVKDNGLGIKKEELSKIFSKFYRIHNAKRNYGFGLGLSYVQWVSKIHNGEVTVESEYGKGSIFTMIIPILDKK
jgi:Signal transduction histidine kinase